MENKIIFANYDCFAFNQSIFLIEDNNITLIKKSEIADLGKNIGELCQSYKINNIKLYGNKEFSEGIVNDIYEYTGKFYSKEELNIEVVE